MIKHIEIFKIKKIVDSYCEKTIHWYIFLASYTNQKHHSFFKELINKTHEIFDDKHSRQCVKPVNKDKNCLGVTCTPWRLAYDS